MTDIDRRALSHMSPETRLTHLRLEVWGNWSKERVKAWPARSLLGRLVEEGPGASQETGTQEMPEPVAITDRAVAHLGVIDRRVIVEYYTRWEPAEALARRCKLRRKQFDSVLKRARWRVGAFIAGVESGLQESKT